MTRMNNVLTLRLPKEDLDAVQQISLQTKKDKSTILRELVELGKMYYAITQYKQGKISIGKTAELAGVNLAELMDTLTSLGIKSNLDVEDYLEGKKYAQKVI